MLQVVDNREARRSWLGALAKAPLELLEAWREGLAAPRIDWLRRPETGLAMVRARIGGTGARFNLGEMTITRCALRLAPEAASGAVGVAYVQGRSHRKAELVALADALLQTPKRQTEVERELLAPLRRRLASDARAMRRKAQSTRVEFFTLVRGED